jgi:hypothetical protein
MKMSKSKDEMIQQVNAFIKTTYSKAVVELNKNVILNSAETDGRTQAPTFKLTSGGGCIIKNKEEKELASPAELVVELDFLDTIQPMYRITLPFDEVSYACTNPGYMKTLFDFVFTQAVANYNLTFGGPDVTRFGEAYLYLPQVEDYRDDFLITFKGQYALQSAVKK